MAKMSRLIVCCSFVVVVLSISCFATYNTTVSDYTDITHLDLYTSWSYTFGTNNNNVFLLESSEPFAVVNHGYDYLLFNANGTSIQFTWYYNGNIHAQPSPYIGTAGSDGGYYFNLLAELDGWYNDVEWDHPMYVLTQNVYQSSLDYLASVAAGSVEPDSYLSYVDIPAGYVAVVYAKNPSSSSPAGLRSNFSWTSAPNAPYWGNTGQSYKFFDSRPVFTDQTLFPLNGMSAIGWDKGRQTGFNGNTTNAVGEISFSSSLHWCVIYNPWVTFDSSAIDPKYNSTIRLHANIAEAYLYPCSQLIGSDGWESRSLDDWSNPYVGNAPVDEGGDWYWTEPSEVPGDPPVVVDPGSGGTNEVPPEVTNQNFLQRIIAILDNLLAEISGLFTFAFRAIVALVDAAASFFAVIGGLFTWLPADVVTVIVSGFFLVVTIGVLKSFL